MWVLKKFPLNLILTENFNIRKVLKKNGLLKNYDYLLIYYAILRLPNSLTLTNKKEKNKTYNKNSTSYKTKLN